MGPDDVRVPARLAFVQQPTETEIGFAISPAIQVAIQDSAGNTATSATHSVTIALEGGPGSTLLGTTTVDAIDGIATFSDLSVDGSGTGYTLVATAPGLKAAASATFDIVFLFARVSAGGSHTCGITIGGATYCWGANTSGQLGFVGPSTGSSRPVRLPDSEFVALSLGTSHSCGLGPDGAAQCWGQNSDGQLGDGSTNIRALPGPVSGGLAFVGLGAGDLHTCGVTTSGQAYCWGSAAKGRLGDGSMSGTRTTPVAVLGGYIFLDVSAGFEHTCGLRNDSRAYCWGSGDNGQLGDGTNTRRAAPYPVSGGLAFESLSAGFVHSCGATPEGVPYCWGVLPVELGSSSSNEPDTVPAAPDLASVDAGWGFSCGRTAAGEAYCWGDNEYGQLGSVTEQLCGSRACSTVPIAVAGGLTFESLSSGLLHACGITVAGELYCWGYDLDGQLGVGGATEVCSTPPTPCSRMPVRVADPVPKAAANL